MPDVNPGLTVGIDVGGTKTHLRAVHGSETVADTVVSSEGWLPADHRQAAAFLADLLKRTLPPETAPTAVAVGAHGCESARDCATLQGELARLLPAECLVLNDAELLVPAVGLDDGVGLVAGTGSVAVGRDRGGLPVYVGGWGWLLGDEGSAPALLREAAKASLAARDRGEPPDLLAEKLVQSYQVAEITRLPDAMAADAGARRWGQRAALVFDALDGGSTLARQVVDRAAQALTALVVQLAAREVAVDDVVVAGGVILNQPPLFDAFTRHLATALPATAVHRLDVPPVHGAVRLAQQLAGAGAAA